VHATRYGKSVRVDIAARRVSRVERSTFDEPDRWQIEVVPGDWPAPALKRLVNGSTRVEREPSGSASWDVNVEFSVAFELPSAVDEVRVTLRPPGRPRAVIRVPVAEVVAMLDEVATEREAR